MVYVGFRRVDDEVRLALVGTGWWAGEWLRALDDCTGVSAVAVVGRTPSRAREATDSWSSPLSAHGTIQDAVRLAGANAALVVTPPATHAELVGDALDLGLPVLVEKPIALDLREAAAMAAAADRDDLLLCVVQNRSTHPALTAMRGWLDAQRAIVGLVHQTYVGTAGTPDEPRGFRHRMAAPLAMDMTVHHVDAVRRLLDTDIVSVDGRSSRLPWSWMDGDTVLAATFTLSSGADYSYTGMWNAIGREDTPEGNWVIATDQGTISWSDGMAPTATTADTQQVLRSEPFRGEGLAATADEFLHALLTGEEPWGAAHNNLRTLAAVQAALESATRGRTVRVDDLLDRASA